MTRFKVALKDIRERRYLDAYAAFLLAIGVVATNVVAAFVTQESKLTLLVSASIVGLLGVLAGASIEIRRDLPGAGDASANVWRFYADRAELPALKEQVEGASSRMEIFGLQLGTVTHSLLPVIRSKAEAGCRFRLALLSPVDVEGQPLSWVRDIGTVHGYPDLDAQLRANIGHLLQWRAGLPYAVRRRVAIRAYARVPTASVILNDVEVRTGYVHVEPILHEFAPTERPIFWIRERDDQSLYRLLVTRYGELWSSATPIEELDL